MRPEVPIIDLPLHMPRHAFTTRDVARAGDVWRAFQEAAVLGSTACGWPPARYRTDGVAFVVRSMRVTHIREVRYGEALRAQTWVRDFRRGILSNREIRLNDGGGDTVASASQQWAHVRADLRPTRASASLLAAFPEEDHGESPVIPAFEESAGERHTLTFGCWHTWMDPIGHANHPAYLDWADEAIAVRLADVGLDPAAVRPIAEELTWRSGVVAGEQVTVSFHLAGRTHSDEAVFVHDISVGERHCARATLVRTLEPGGSEALFASFGAAG